MLHRGRPCFNQGCRLSGASRSQAVEAASRLTSFCVALLPVSGYPPEILEAVENSVDGRTGVLSLFHEEPAVDLNVLFPRHQKHGKDINHGAGNP
jgi:hypothetical protein